MDVDVRAPPRDAVVLRCGRLDRRGAGRWLCGRGFLRLAVRDGGARPV
jgi:hypothetical protein